MIRTFVRGFTAAAGVVVGLGVGVWVLQVADRFLTEAVRELVDELDRREARKRPVSPLTGEPLDGEARRG